MRKLAILLAVHAFSVYAACPEKAPGSMALEIVEACTSSTGCPNGPVTFVIEPVHGNPMSGLPWPGYWVQPCDVIEWDFGDGTAQIVHGLDRVTHDYPNPGNYAIRAKVINALGNRQVTNTAVIATSPTRLSFVTSTFKVPFPTYESTCTNCVEAREGEPVTITVTRSLDLSRTVSAVAAATVDHTKFSVPLTFAPAITQQSYTFTVPDDHVYSGVRYSPLRFANPQGGTLTFEDGSLEPTLVVIENDPIPTFSIVPSVRVLEGHSGMAQISIPVSLTAPMGLDTLANTVYRPGSATPLDYLAGASARIKAGETSGEATAWIRGNSTPEPDKVFEVVVGPRFTNADPLFGTKTALVTIVNDDAAVYPAQTTAGVGSLVQLTLDLGSPFSVNTVVEFTSSDERVVVAPAPVVVPAGVTKVEVVVRPRGKGLVQIGAEVRDRVTAPAEITAVGGRRRAAAH